MRLALDNPQLGAELGERHCGALVVADHGPQLGKLDLSGGELGTGPFELLAKVQGLAPPPERIIAGGLDLGELGGDGSGLTVQGDPHRGKCAPFKLALLRLTCWWRGGLDLGELVHKLDRGQGLNGARYLVAKGLDCGKRQHPSGARWGLHLLGAWCLPGGDPPADCAGVHPEGGSGGLDGIAAEHGGT